MRNFKLFAYECAALSFFYFFLVFVFFVEWCGCVLIFWLLLGICVFPSWFMSGLSGFGKVGKGSGGDLGSLCGVFVGSSRGWFSCSLGRDLGFYVGEFGREGEMGKGKSGRNVSRRGRDGIISAFWGENWGLGHPKK